MDRADGCRFQGRCRAVTLVSRCQKAVGQLRWLRGDLGFPGPIQPLVRPPSSTLSSNWIVQHRPAVPRGTFCKQSLEQSLALQLFPQRSRKPTKWTTTERQILIPLRPMPVLRKKNSRRALLYSQMKYYNLTQQWKCPHRVHQLEEISAGIPFSNLPCPPNCPSHTKHPRHDQWRLLHRRLPILPRFWLVFVADHQAWTAFGGYLGESHDNTPVRKMNSWAYSYLGSFWLDEAIDTRVFCRLLLFSWDSGRQLTISTTIAGPWLNTSLRQ